jgi:hypothetical protein
MTDTAVAGKLRIKEGDRVWVSDASRASLVGGLPAGASIVTDRVPNAGTAVALVVADDEATLRAVLDDRVEALAAVPALWIAYPKGNRADINRDSLWPILAEHGLRPITQVALDDTWSALRFRPLRPDEPPFTGGG